MNRANRLQKKGFQFFRKKLMGFQLNRGGGTPHSIRVIEASELLYQHQSKSLLLSVYIHEYSAQEFVNKLRQNVNKVSIVETSQNIAPYERM